MADAEYLAFPRLIAVAELAWTRETGEQGWNGFRRRIGAHGTRLTALGINYYHTPEVEWE